MSVGSAPLMTPVAKPIENPPSVAVQSRSMPPTTTPTSTMIVSFSAKSGATSGFWTVRRTETAAAMTAESRTAVAITVFARTPRSRAVPKSVAAARICRPIRVRVSSSARSDNATAATTTATMVTFRTSTPQTVIARLSDATDAAGSPIVSSRTSIRSATFCRMKATANVVTSITAGDCVRSGRNTSRSMAPESRITTTKHMRIPAHVGQPACDVNASV